MSKDCRKCIYHGEVKDMGGGTYIVCGHPESTSSWPDRCPLDCIPEEEDSNGRND